MKVNCQEIFGSRRDMEPYQNFDEACGEIKLFQLRPAGWLVTRTLKLLFQAYDEVGGRRSDRRRYPSFRIDQMPYGGVKTPAWAGKDCATRSRK